jgi:hypothetical protein
MVDMVSGCDYLRMMASGRRPVRRADEPTTFMSRLSGNLEPPRTLGASPGLYRDSFTFTFTNSSAACFKPVFGDVNKDVFV